MGIDLPYSLFLGPLLVRIIGVEPTCLAAPDPKSGASANFATSARVLRLLPTMLWGPHPLLFASHIFGVVSQTEPSDPIPLNWGGKIRDFGLNFCHSQALF